MEDVNKIVLGNLKKRDSESKPSDGWRIIPEGFPTPTELKNTTPTIREATAPQPGQLWTVKALKQLEYTQEQIDKLQKPKGTDGLDPDRDKINFNKYMQNKDAIFAQAKKQNITIEHPEKTIEDIRNEIYLLLSFNPAKTHQATELIVTEFLKNNKIYAIRDDKSEELWVYKEGIYVPDGKSYIEQYVRIILEERCTTPFTNRVIHKIKIDSYIKKEEFFNPWSKYQVPVQNGILHIKSKKLRPFTPKKIFFNKLGISYDETKKINSIDTFLKEILAEDDIPIIQELFGYLLLRDYPIQKAFMFLGNGSNGKSALLSLLKSFIGDESCSNVTLDELQGNDFSASELFQKYCNIAGDISSKQLSDTSKFKQVTGSDRIAANRKFMTPIYFTNFAKMIHACNDLPQTRDLSDGFWRRWILLNFKEKFVPLNDFEKLSLEEKKEVKLADPMVIKNVLSDDELSGLLNWALEGLGRLLRQQSFSYSKSGKQVQSEWIRRSNSFAAFCMDMLVEDTDGFIPKEILDSEYTKYCRLHKSKRESTKIMFNFLNDWGCWEERPRVDDSLDRPRIWKGLRFCNDSKVLISLKFNEKIGQFYYENDFEIESI